jgi:1-acyl-sn-glycerol-3-phosphate acyltransferase
MTVSSLERKNTRIKKYDHNRLEWQRRFLRFLIRTIGFSLLVKLEKVEGLDHIPAEGPAIMMINHIALVDPIAVLHVIPRRNIVPMAKIEVYNYPIVGIFPRIWGVIPVRREEVDRRAIQHALDVLKAGEIILVAPEAHRGPQLQMGKEGVAYLANRARVPIIPVAVEGTPGFPSIRFSKRWFGPGVTIRFGQPFQYNDSFLHPSREQLRLMTDEAMYRLANILPEVRRGYYADLSKASMETIHLL